MKTANDLIEIIGGTDKFIHCESGAIIQLVWSFWSLLVSIDLGRTSLIITQTLLLSLFGFIIVYLFTRLKEILDKKEGGKFDHADIRATMLGCVIAFVLVSVCMILYVLTHG